MLARTHLTFGFLTALWLSPIILPKNNYVFFTFILLGSLIPDIDNSQSLISSKIPVLPSIIGLLTKHRGIFHSLFLAALLPGLVWYFISKPYGFALFVGYVSHLLIDGFTKMGVNLLHPFFTLKIEGPIETGKIAEHVVLAILLFLIVLRLI